MTQFKNDCSDLKAGKISLDRIVNCTSPDYDSSKTINPNTTISQLPKMIRIKKDVNYRNAPNFEDCSIAGIAKAGEVFTVVGLVERSDTDMYKLKSGCYITTNRRYVEEIY